MLSLAIVYVCVSVLFGGELYVFGGYNGLHDAHFADMYKYNPGKSNISSPKLSLFKYGIFCLHPYLIV